MASEDDELQRQAVDRATLIVDIPSPEGVKAGRCIGFDRRQTFEPGAPVLGVALMDRGKDRTASVAIAGAAFVESGGVFEAGDALAVDRRGCAVRATELLVWARPGHPDGSDDACERSAAAVYAEHVFARAIMPSRRPGVPVWVRLGR